MASIFADSMQLLDRLGSYPHVIIKQACDALIFRSSLFRPSHSFLASII